MTGPWVRLELDVAAFDGARFPADAERCRRAGARFSTMATLRDSAEHRRALYEPNKECAADLPGLGPFHTYEEYLERRIRTAASYDPHGVVIALDGGGRWIGLSAISDWRAEGTCSAR
ncbi:hypothetical protein [Streptomyces katrae]|uniref:hypothetical protein n=1 Tax=Streptomyces katrae TaxID=68223 RepID=UPI001F2F0772|nr:hypothetical protein [Streptomyces katrae]